MPAYDFWWVNTPIADLGWEHGVVQFGHHSYDPTRHCATCGPNTWHWDTVLLEPAVPFTILRADRRVVDAASDGVLRFAGPAPAGAHLRFAALGRGVEVSFDGGATWEAAQRQAQLRAHGERFASYWHAVPAGVSTLQFRAEATAGGLPWLLRDAAIWSIALP